MTEIKAGDQVAIHYTGRLEDGTVFDSSQGRDPLEFVAGSEDLISGISQAVIGMKPGESKTVTVAPEQGYGERMPNQAQRVDRNQLPEEITLGTALQVESPQGKNFTVWVTELNEESAMLDMNHPLAGLTLVFDIELVPTN